VRSTNYEERPNCNQSLIDSRSFQKKLEKTKENSPDKLDSLRLELELSIYTRINIRNVRIAAIKGKIRYSKDGNRTFKERKLVQVRPDLVVGETIVG
jgi:hypothetical protein